MKFNDFDKLTERIFNDVRAMRDGKGKEYARTGDRFDNFNRLAAKLHLHRLKVWHVYFTKHMDAIDSFVDNHRTFSNENIHGRFIDAITYLTLALGMIKEEFGEQDANAGARVSRKIQKARGKTSRSTATGRNGTSARFDPRGVRRTFRSDSKR